MGAPEFDVVDKKDTIETLNFNVTVNLDRNLAKENLTHALVPPIWSGSLASSEYG